MEWYSILSYVYDLFLERLYEQHRKQMVATLRPDLGHRVVDLACGTGQNFVPLLNRLPEGSVEIIGIDSSPGMLRRARRRIERLGGPNVCLMEADGRSVGRRVLRHALGGDFEPDSIVCALGLTAIPDWQVVFQRFFELLRPRGQFLIFDVHAERRVPQTWWVEKIARADLSRRVWEPLAETSADFELRFLPGSPHVHGGRLFLASGLKPT